MAILIRNKHSRKVHVRKPGKLETLCGIKNKQIPKKSYVNIADTVENRRDIKCNGCSIVNNEFFGKEA